jgi:hypothetical protein
VSRRDFLFASWLLLVSRQHPAACFLLSPQAKENKLLEKSDAFAPLACAAALDSMHSRRKIIPDTLTALSDDKETKGLL